jgi:hypothetical protein
MNKYLKYLLYLLPIVLLVYLGRKYKQNKTNSMSADSINPVEPPHSHDYAYKRAYLNPVEKINHTCRANRDYPTCTNNCMNYHYNFPNCVYKQPKCVELAGEDNKESQLAKKIKNINYY